MALLPTVNSSAVMLDRAAAQLGLEQLASGIIQITGALFAAYVVMLVGAELVGRVWGLVLAREHRRSRSSAPSLAHQDPVGGAHV